MIYFIGYVIVAMVTCISCTVICGVLADDEALRQKYLHIDRFFYGKYTRELEPLLGLAVAIFWPILLLGLGCFTIGDVIIYNTRLNRLQRIEKQTQIDVAMNELDHLLEHK